MSLSWIHAYKERHHKIIRSHVVDRTNTTSLEQGLAEDLVVHTLRDLKAQPIRDGFINARTASTALTKMLVESLGCSGKEVNTCSAARSGAITVHRGDVAVFTLDGRTMTAGDVIFFASSLEWGECAFCGAWARAPDRDSPGFWKFKVNRNDLVQVPVHGLIEKAFAFIGDDVATLVCPPILNFL